MNQRAHETIAMLTGPLAQTQYRADFCDAWSVESSALQLWALDHFMLALAQTPAWVERCLRWRNLVTSPLGLKPMGNLASLSDGRAGHLYRCGDPVGSLTLIRNERDDALLGLADRHLDLLFRMRRQPSTRPARVTISLTTVVLVHNVLGRAHLLAAVPVHRLVVPAMLDAIRRAGADGGTGGSPGSAQ